MRPSMLGVKNHNGPASVKENKKLTFEEWMALKFDGVYGYDKTRPDDFLLWGMPGRLVRAVWKAAQENKQ